VTKNVEDMDIRKVFFGVCGGGGWDFEGN